MADLARSYEVAIEPWMASNYISEGDEARHVVDEATTYMRAVCKPFEARVLGTAQIPMVYHRWRESPPLDKQLARYAANLRLVAQAAEAEGNTLALENHCDYWQGSLYTCGRWSTFPLDDPKRVHLVEAADLLSQILLQVIEQRAAGAVLREGVSQYPMVSVHDPQMHCGR